MDNRMEWKLKRIRKKIKLSGSLADYVGVSYNMLSLYEHGHANMDEQKVFRYKKFIEEYGENKNEIAR